MLLTFVPGFSHPVLQIDASDKQGERLVLEMQLAVLRVRPLRPGEAPFFSAACPGPIIRFRSQRESSGGCVVCDMPHS